MTEPAALQSHRSSLMWKEGDRQTKISSKEKRSLLQPHFKESTVPPRALEYLGGKGEYETLLRKDRQKQREQTPNSLEGKKRRIRQEVIEEGG